MLSGQQLFWTEVRLRWTRAGLARLGLACFLVLLLDAGFTTLFLRSGGWDLPGPTSSREEVQGFLWRNRVVGLSHLGSSPVILAQADAIGDPTIRSAIRLTSPVRLWSIGILRPLWVFVMPGALALAFLGARWRMEEAREQGVSLSGLWWGMGGAAALPFALALVAAVLLDLISPAGGSWSNPAAVSRSLYSLYSWASSWITQAVICLSVGAIARRKDVALILSYGWVFVLAPQLPYAVGVNNPVAPELFILRGVVDFLLSNARVLVPLAVALGAHWLSLQLLARRFPPKAEESEAPDDRPTLVSQHA